MLKTHKLMIAFSNAMKDLYYLIPDDWELIELKEAASILKGYFARNTIESYRKKGWIRGEGDKLYKQEVEMLKSTKYSIDYCFDKGWLEKIKDKGRDYIILNPTMIAKFSQTEVDQEAKSWAKLQEEGYIQKILTYINTEKVTARE